MDIQEIDIGNTLARTCLQGSQRLVVSFESGGDSNRLQTGADPAWAQYLVQDAGWDGLHIMPRVLDWYQAPEIWNFFKALRQSGFFDPYESVVTYGNSMGGFAALAFAKLAGAERVVALQPRSSLRWSVPWPSAQSAKLEYSRVGPRADALDGLSAGMQVLVFSDPFYARDMAHTARVLRAHAGASHYRVPFVAHEVPAFFAETGLMGELARRAISGRLDRRWYRDAMRARGDSGIYRRGLRATLSRRGKTEGAIIQQGVRQLGPDPKEE